MIEFSSEQVDVIRTVLHTKEAFVGSLGGWDGDLKFGIDSDSGRYYADLFYQARDVDGDWGTAITRHTVNDFNELIDVIKYPNKHFNTRSWN